MKGGTKEEGRTGRREEEEGRRAGKGGGAGKDRGSRVVKPLVVGGVAEKIATMQMEVCQSRSHIFGYEAKPVSL